MKTENMSRTNCYSFIKLKGTGVLTLPQILFSVNRYIHRATVFVSRHQVSSQMALVAIRSPPPERKKRFG
jgi:hypothetical protein